MKFINAVLAVVATTTTTTTTLAQDDTTGTILDVVVASSNHNTLETALINAPEAISDLLSNPNVSLTLFAPDDAAFNETFDQELLPLFLTEPWQEHLGCVLKGHVHDTLVPSVAITENVTVESLEEDYNLTLTPVDATVEVNGIPVSLPDIVASNGVIHSLSADALTPPCITENIVERLLENTGDFSMLIDLVIAADLQSALIGDPTEDGMTVFAPTNDAFAKVAQPVLDFLVGNVTELTKVLFYHVAPANEYYPPARTTETLNDGQVLDVTVDGDTVMINGAATVIDTTLASNGVIHTIDSVLLPSNVEVPAPMPAVPPPAATPTVSPPVESPVETPVESPVAAPTTSTSGSRGLASIGSLAGVGAMILSVVVGL